MHRLVDSIDRSRVRAAWFLTGTNVTWEVPWEDYEAVRARYFERVRRRWGDAVCVVWKKEPHPKSGSPHLHGLWFWVKRPPSLDEFRAWNDDAWAESVGRSVDKVRVTGSKVEVMRSWEGCGWYCSTYLEKMQSKWPTVGKLWGVHNRKLLPITFVHDVLSADVGKRMRRTLRKLQERRRRRLLVWSAGDRRWFPIRPGVVTASGWRRVDDESRPRLTADQVASQMVEVGLRVKRAKRAVMRRRTVRVWVEGEEVVRGRVKRWIERGDDETESVLYSWHSIDSGELLRLRDFLLRPPRGRYLTRSQHAGGLPQVPAVL